MGRDQVGRFAMVLLTLFSISASMLADSSGDITLGVGEKAPAFHVDEWCHGKPLTALDSNKIYIVEFWSERDPEATQLVTHLAKLQHKFPRVLFTSVDVGPKEDEATLADFVGSLGEKIDFSVGYAPDRSDLATEWLAASGHENSPTAFIVSRGYILWIGSPGQLDTPLKQLEANTFRYNDGLIAFRQVKARQSFEKIERLYKDGHVPEGCAKLEEFLPNNRDYLPEVVKLRADALNSKDDAVFDAQAKALAHSKWSFDRAQLIDFLSDDFLKRRDRKDRDSKAVEWLATNPAIEHSPQELFDLGGFQNFLRDYRSALSTFEKCLAALPDQEHLYENEREIKRKLKSIIPELKYLVSRSDSKG